MLGNVIPLPEFKKLLGPAGENLSDEEILRIREVEDRLADIVFEMWLKHRRGPDGGGSAIASFKSVR
jgi:hypothetical protein